MSGDEKELLVGLFRAAVAAAQPELCLPPHLPPPPEGALIVLAAGKAAAAMARAAVTFYREAHGLDGRRLRGSVVTRQGYGLDTAPLPLIEAGHPIPDDAGLSAAAIALDFARAAGPDDLVLVLLSGGGSALWSAPIPPLGLAGKQALTAALSRAGATIGELNTVRKHLSLIKGGRLARAARPARLVTLAISDVPGDDPAVIASGPTVPDPTTQADALAVLARHRVGAAEAVRAILAEPRNESIKPGDEIFAGARFALVARPAMALAAARAQAEAAGIEVIGLGDALQGEARHLAATHAMRARAARRRGRPVLLLSGGEATVTVTGSGRGGPNQEYALALAMALEGAEGIHAIACDTDGTDGGAGSPHDPAGACIDPTTLARARMRGLDAAKCLADNNSGSFFKALGDLVVSGPTYTNVNDFRAILVEG